jgi:segregation and condensation protein B
LDYFNLKNLDELPSLAEIRDLDSMNGELELEGADTLSIDLIDTITQESKSDADIAEQVALVTTDTVSENNDDRDENVQQAQGLDIDSDPTESDPTESDLDSAEVDTNMI